jgi:hypothetical protein
MVNRAERASLQKSVIDDVNNHITASITEKLKTKRQYNGELFVSTRPEVFYFKTDDWMYSVSCINSDMNAYRVVRSSFWVDASGNTIYRNDIKKMTTEEYLITPASFANKAELKYCDPYNNHIARRWGICHTRVSCPFKMNSSTYLDLLLKNLTDTPDARVIAPCPDYKEPVVELGKIPPDLAVVEKAVNFVELPDIEPLVIEEQIEPVMVEPVVEPVVEKTKRKRNKK